MPTSDDRKVVWILGAGFSRPLGGPLLSTLFTPSSYEDVKLRFAGVGELARNPVQLVVRLFQYGRRWADGVVIRNLDEQQKPGELLWEHAEEFLEYLDLAAAAPSGPRAARITAIGSKLMNTTPVAEIGDIAAAARRLLAAECAAFLTDADTKSEKWAPYHAWASTLREHDTVVTFNYDRVLEALDAKYLDVQADHDGWLPEGSKCARVLKLHGSVDWHRRLGPSRAVTFARTNDPNFAVSCAPEFLAIASPGASKARATGELVRHWKLASERIADADAIVFVGYRFPPSDAQARGELLDAISANRKAGRLRIHTVLGPPPNDTAIRLEWLLRTACERGGRVVTGNGNFYAVTTHPLYAQDFFSLYRRNMLFAGP